MSRADDYFHPQIVDDSPPPQQARGLGRFDGGFGEQSDVVDPGFSSGNSPKRNAPTLLDKMNTTAPGPFNPSRPGPDRNNMFPPRRLRSADGPTKSDGTAVDIRPGTSASHVGGGPANLKIQTAPQDSSYGGYGRSGAVREAFGPSPFGTHDRSGTFPRQSSPSEAPTRTPSAPSARSDRSRQESMNSLVSDTSSSVTSRNGSTRRPSKDTSRAPPPRTGLIVKSPGVPSINLAAEFGVDNPYHTASESVSSDGSRLGHSAQSSQSSRPSQPSSRSSPSRSIASRSERHPSDVSNLDNNLLSLAIGGKPSMDSLRPKPGPIQLPPRERSSDKFPLSPMGSRPPAPGGYDSRIDPRPDRAARKMHSSSSLRPSGQSYRANSLAGSADNVSDVDDQLPPPPPPLKDDRGGSHRLGVPQYLPSPPPETPDTPDRSFMGRSQHPAPTPVSPGPYKPHSMSSTPSTSSGASRGLCRACGEAITGKSISSKDGRLTGKYHKACFVCTTCHEPFSSSTFYVLDDKPYCQLDYHRLNGSLCEECGTGIEGPYLAKDSSPADDPAVYRGRGHGSGKYHEGCFRCPGCHVVLQDGYCEVDGQAYCEKDAWRRIQHPWPAQQPHPPQQPANGFRRPPPGPSNLGAGAHGPRMMGGPRAGNGLVPPPGGMGMSVGMGTGLRNGGYGGGGGGYGGGMARMEKRRTRMGMVPALH